MTKIPEIKTERTKDYASLIACGFDTVQETFRIIIPDNVQDELEQEKQFALENHEGVGTRFIFGGEEFQAWSGSSAGCKWVVSNDDYQLHFMVNNGKHYALARYLSGGLWEHGYDAIRARIEAVLESTMYIKNCDNWCTLSRADVAFDFYSPKFTTELTGFSIVENLLMTSGVKANMYFTSTGIQTITIGTNQSAIQIQIYDKGKEIIEKSGKRWMLEVWEREGYFPPEDQKFKDIYRVEIRFRKQYFKDRNITDFKELEKELSGHVAESIFRRRMVVPDGQSKRERWPLHALWAEVYHASGKAAEYAPIGRQITKNKDEYIEILEKQVQGLCRSLSVLDCGHFNSDDTKAATERLIANIPFDIRHDQKILKTVEKMRFMNEAQ